MKVAKRVVLKFSRLEKINLNFSLPKTLPDLHGPPRALQSFANGNLSYINVGSMRDGPIYGVYPLHFEVLGGQCIM